MPLDVKINSEWKEVLKDYFETENFGNLTDFIKSQYQTKVVYPSAVNIFKAFDLTPFSKVKVVILGQDPYHGAGQAQGLSFSVPSGMKLPPSLQNIYKEIESDLGVKMPKKSPHLREILEKGWFLGIFRGPLWSFRSERDPSPSNL